MDLSPECGGEHRPPATMTARFDCGTRSHFARSCQSASILIAGVEYLRSRDAARIVQLAPDYVSRLARENLIDGRQVAGLWFVNLASLKSFIASKNARKKSGARNSRASVARSSSQPDTHQRSRRFSPDVCPRVTNSMRDSTATSAAHSARVRRAPRSSQRSPSSRSSAAPRFAFQDIAPNTFARATAAPKHLASQLAAASSLPWLDGIAGRDLSRGLPDLQHLRNRLELRNIPSECQADRLLQSRIRTRPRPPANVKHANPIPQARQAARHADESGSNAPASPPQIGSKPTRHRTHPRSPNARE